MATRISHVTDRYMGRKGLRPFHGPDVEALAKVMFRDTVTARMLRHLCSEGHMPQAVFMSRYDAACRSRPGKRKSSGRSSFACNWSRFCGHLSIRCIVRETSFDGEARRMMLHWAGPGWDGLIADMSDQALQSAYEAMERLTIEDVTQADIYGRPWVWLAAIREEIARRAART
jgi:hypothetical protein